MPSPARKAKDTKGTARAGVRRVRSDPKVGKLTAAEAAYKAALEQQAASADILSVISRSPGQGQPVFEMIARSAVRLSDAVFCNVTRFDGEMLHVAAHHGFDRGFVKRLHAMYPMRPTPNQLSGRVVLKKAVVGIADALADRQYNKGYAQAGGWHRMLGVPMVSNGDVLGVIVVAWKDAGVTPKAQVNLLKNFAQQAAIAIQNARLFNETKEALERETASAEVLKVLSGSMADVQPVLDAVAERAARLSGVMYASLFLESQGVLRRVAGFGPRPADNGDGIPMRRTLVNSRSFIERRTVHVPDILPLLDSEYPDARNNQERLKFRSMLAVPLMRETKAIGTLGVWRREVRPFTENEISLLETFAAQAVIAIENARLFNETRQALERQTATGKILGSISASIADAQPVFDAIADSLRKLFVTPYAVVALIHDGKAHLKAIAGEDRFTARVKAAYPWALDDPGMIAAKAVHERRVVQLSFTAGMQDVVAKSAKLGPAGEYQSIVFAPLCPQGQAIGFTGAPRTEPPPLDDKQIALIQSFADQAVIAIENARLFNETREALERQTATADILKVIATSPSDVQPVLDTVAERAARICGAVHSTLYFADGEVLRRKALWGDHEKGILEIPIKRTMANGRAFIDKRTVHIPDILPLLDSEYPAARPNQRRVGWRACVSVPLLRKQDAIGTINVWRTEPGPFSEEQVRLLETFANQAVIAIENVRLFNETKEALEQQTATSEILKVISRSTTDVQPVFDTISRNARQLLDGSSAGLIVIEESQACMVAYATASDAEAYANALKAYPMALDVLARERPQFMDVLESGKPASMTDIEVEQAGKTELLSFARSAGIRSNAVVPMMRAGRPIGLIVVNRREPHATTTDEFRLLETFAAQAVIAIENVRLFNETNEALEQQTAITEVLRVISASPTDVRPVLQAVAERATRICEADDARVFTIDGDVLRAAAGLGPLHLAPDATVPAAGSIMGAAIKEGASLQLDVATAPAEQFPFARRMYDEFGHRVILVTPLLRENRPLGAIILRRTEGRLFSPKQVRLLETFAEQAAIAIENVRLFNETKEALERQREALEQQTAVSEVLRVISASPTNVEPVLQAVAERAMRICESKDARIFLVDGDVLRYVAGGGDVELGEGAQTRPIDRRLVMGRAVIERRPIHVDDLATAADEFPLAYQAHEKWGHRTTLAVPLLRDDKALGAILLRRAEVRPFAPQQIALLKAFADQAAIAI